MHTNETYSTRPRHRWVVVTIFNSLVILAAVPTLVESKSTVNMEKPGKLQNNHSIPNYLVDRDIHL